MTTTPTAPAPAPSRAPSDRRRRVWAAVGIVVAAVLVLAALYATGLFPAHGSTGSTPPGPDETFDQASPAGVGAASVFPGGPWLAFLGAAVAIPSPTFISGTNVSQLIEAINCTITWAGAADPSIYIPSTSPGAATGHAAFWIFGLRNTTGAIAVTLVSDGTGTALFLATGASCQNAGSHANPIDGAVDSPTAVAAANASGGSAYLVAHPNATRGWAVFGGVQVGPLASGPTWGVGYTTCVLPATVGQNGTEFNATVNALTGIVSAHTEGSVNCALSTVAPVSLLAPNASSSVIATAPRR